jgi:hypothetical protein
MRNIGFLGLVLKVLGDCENFQAVTVGFFDPDRGPDLTIGENRVRVQVCSQHDAAISRVREFDRALMGGGRRRIAGNCEKAG